MTPRGSYVRMLHPQSVELFGEDQEMWPYWRRCITEGWALDFKTLEVSVPPSSLSTITSHK